MRELITGQDVFSWGSSLCALGPTAFCAARWLWDFCWGRQHRDTLQHCVPSEATQVCDGCDALRAPSVPADDRAASWLVGFSPGRAAGCWPSLQMCWLVCNTSVLQGIESQNGWVWVGVSGRALWSSGSLIPFRSQPSAIIYRTCWKC